jgi:hypothetical protein
MRTSNTPESAGSTLHVEETSEPKKDLRSTKPGRRRYRNCIYIRRRKACSKAA